jgi:hypothetical protein
MCPWGLRVKGGAEVQNRIRSLLDEEFRLRVEAAQERLPACCVYNYRHTLDVRKKVQGDENTEYNRITRGDNRSGLPVVQTIGLCMYGQENPDTWPGTICEDPVDAMRCPPQAFTPKVGPEIVKTEFETQIKDLNWVQKHLPEVHALLWVLGTDKIPEPPPPPKPTEDPPPIVLSRWARFFLWLAGLSRHRFLPPSVEG